jgi:Tfp pilus assembly protein PilO
MPRSTPNDDACTVSDLRLRNIRPFLYLQKIMVMVMIIIIIIIITITTIIGSSFSVIERQTDRERCVKFVMA